jgi:CBS domain containing-hemolysin-like protein
MSPYLPVGAVFVSAAGSLLFSTLTYSLRELSRVRLAEHLARRGREDLLEPTLNHVSDLILVTAVCRMLANTGILLSVLICCDRVFVQPLARYASTAIIAGIITLFSSVAVPHALTRHAGDAIVAACVGMLHVMRWVFWPVIRLMHVIDNIIGRSVGAPAADEPDAIEHEIEQEILSAVEEGAKEGVVDEEEREMIESVIQFHDTTAGQIMTPRPEIVGVEVGSTLALVKETLEESGHSRLPVYVGSLDHILGVLYARDLLKHIGLPAGQFNVKSAMRPAYFVPETKPLRDLLADFRLQKVHLAIVIDEYGGTAGLVTIEDVLEELVGDIADEHEPVEPAMFKRLDDNSAEVDARIYIDELNRLMSLNLPEDAGYDTLGGYVSTTLGKIPETGTTFDHDGAKFTVLNAEPQKVNRVRIDVIPQHAGEMLNAD